MTLGGVPVIWLSGPCTNEGIPPLVVYKYPLNGPPFLPPSLSPPSLLCFSSNLLFFYILSSVPVAAPVKSHGFVLGVESGER